MTARDVLAFWFGEADGLADEAHQRRWFMPDAAVDADVRTRFGHLLPAALRGELDGWLQAPATTLALVIVCDQFSRQVHRGSAEAFATDGLALEAARALVAQGADRSLGLDRRAFLYMPFEHSESRLDQHLSVGLFSALAEEAPADVRGYLEGFLDYAREHRDVVVRFGRFPHRNRILGRPSTAEELEFLETASSYGQASPPG